jgi:hypothetical protein
VAAAGCLSLLLLLWVEVFDDSWETVITRVPPCHFREPLGNLVTAALSLSVLTTLYPVVRLPRSPHKWSAALLVGFPLLIFALGVLSLVGFSGLLAFLLAAVCVPWSPLDLPRV